MGGAGSHAYQHRAYSDNNHLLITILGSRGRYEAARILGRALRSSNNDSEGRALVTSDERPGRRR